MLHGWLSYLLYRTSTDLCGTLLSDCNIIVMKTSEGLTPSISFLLVLLVMESSQAFTI